MFLHIGGSKYLRTDEIIGFFDIETSTREAATRNFLKSAESAGMIETVCKDLPKSFVPTSPINRRCCQYKTKAQEFKKNKLYISASAVTTMKKRVSKMKGCSRKDGT